MKRPENHPDLNRGSEAFRPHFQTDSNQPTKTMKTATILCTSVLFAAHAYAEEGGAGHYVPGAAATLIDLPPTKTGWVLETAYLHYQGDAGGNAEIPDAGLITANLDATSDALLFGGFYTFEPCGNAWFSVGAFIPYVWMDVSARVTSSVGTGRRDDSADGLGDITLLPFMLGYKCGDWQYSAMLPIYAPTGDYDLGRLANPGRNYWTFDPTVGVSYNNPKTGFNAALFTAFSINTENNDTNYKSGTVWHSELSVQQLLPLGPGFIGVGFEAFYYDQITGDSGSGANLGDFEGMTTGIGPVLTYVLPVGENSLVTELRWLPELDTRKRLEGDYVWFKAVYQF